MLPSECYRLIGEAAKQLLDECDGVAVTTRSQFLSDLTLTDRRLEDMPECVGRHFTVGLSRHGVMTRALVGNDPETLIVWSTNRYETEGAARRAARLRGLGKPLQKIAQADSRLSVA